MPELTALRAMLQPHVGWHGARILFVAAFIIALFRARTVNLSELSVAFPGQAKPESHYKRQQRFFRHFTVDYGVIARMVIALMSIPEPWVLAIDCSDPLILTKRRRVWGRWVYISATRLEDNSLLVVATDQIPETAIADYALR